MKRQRIYGKWNQKSEIFFSLWNGKQSPSKCFQIEIVVFRVMKNVVLFKCIGQNALSTSHSHHYHHYCLSDKFSFLFYHFDLLFFATNPDKSTFGRLVNHLTNSSTNYSLIVHYHRFMWILVWFFFNKNHSFSLLNWFFLPKPRQIKKNIISHSVIISPGEKKSITKCNKKVTLTDQ